MFVQVPEEPAERRCLVVSSVADMDQDVVGGRRSARLLGELDPAVELVDVLDREWVGLGEDMSWRSKVNASHASPLSVNTSVPLVVGSLAQVV